MGGMLIGMKVGVAALGLAGVASYAGGAAALKEHQHTALGTGLSIAGIGALVGASRMAGLRGLASAGAVAAGVTGGALIGVPLATPIAGAIDGVAGASAHG